MSSTNAASIQNVSSAPHNLRALVLDYLFHQCYTNTAKAFFKESTVRHLDADGDEVQPSSSPSQDIPLDDVKQAELRRDIREQILCGQVDEATAMLNEHFPSVLSGPVFERIPNPSARGRSIADAIPYASPTSVDPAHLTLNLRILAFIEACRTVPLPYPRRDADTPTPQTQPDSPDDDSTVSLEQQLILLSKAQKLLGLANMLTKSSDRDLYLKELKNVGGLLAYRVPERSSISKYLSQGRREAVADQINRAILDRAGLPPVSSIELVARYTSTVWSFANQVGVKPRQGVGLPPSPRKGLETVPPFDLKQFLDAKT